MSEFVAGILIGGLVGFGLDYFLGTSPFLFVLFILIGFGAGMLNMVRASKKQMDTEIKTTDVTKN